MGLAPLFGSMPDLTPEQLARRQIDAQLAACGWVVQDYKAVDFSAGRGIALREVPLTTGPCDYLLLVDRKALGVIEAEKAGATSSTAAGQTQIVNDVERRLSVVDGLKSVVTANLQRATRLRQSILQNAFTGELSP